MHVEVTEMNRKFQRMKGEIATDYFVYCKVPKDTSMKRLHHLNNTALYWLRRLLEVAHALLEIVHHTPPPSIGN